MQTIFLISNVGFELASLEDQSAGNCRLRLMKRIRFSSFRLFVCFLCFSNTFFYFTHTHTHTCAIHSEPIRFVVSPLLLSCPALMFFPCSLLQRSNSLRRLKMLFKAAVVVFNLKGLVFIFGKTVFAKHMLRSLFMFD